MGSDPALQKSGITEITKKMSPKKQKALQASNFYKFKICIINNLL